MQGIITAIHGDVIEIEFSDGLPSINDGLIVEKPDKKISSLKYMTKQQRA